MVVCTVGGLQLGGRGAKQSRRRKPPGPSISILAQSWKVYYPLSRMIAAKKGRFMPLSKPEGRRKRQVDRMVRIVTRQREESWTREREAISARFSAPLADDRSPHLADRPSLASAGCCSKMTMGCTHHINSSRPVPRFKAVRANLAFAAIAGSASRAAPLPPASAGIFVIASSASCPSRPGRQPAYRRRQISLRGRGPSSNADPIHTGRRPSSRSGRNQIRLLNRHKVSSSVVTACNPTCSKATSEVTNVDKGAKKLGGGVLATPH